MGKESEVVKHEAGDVMMLPNPMTLIEKAMDKGALENLSLIHI